MSTLAEKWSASPLYHNLGPSLDSILSDPKKYSGYHFDPDKPNAQGYLMVDFYPEKDTLDNLLKDIVSRKVKGFKITPPQKDSDEFFQCLFGVIPNIVDTNDLVPKTSSNDSPLYFYAPRDTEERKLIDGIFASINVNGLSEETIQYLKKTAKEVAASLGFKFTTGLF